MKSTLTPIGVRDYSPEETEALSRLKQEILAQLSSSGYRRVLTPSLEFYETIRDGLGPKLAKQCIKFTDSHGQTLVLRPDHTAAIARSLSTRYSDESLPIRLAYVDPVFRKDPQRGETEEWQAGVEHIGDESIAADVAVIDQCIQCLKACGITDFGIDLGHTDVLASYSEDEQAALLDGDYTILDNLPKRGGIECLDEFPALKSLYQDIQSSGYIDDRVQANLGLVKDPSYYSGMIFDVYVPGYGKRLGSGGRYDGLLSRFGRDLPAVGFALDLGAIQEYLA